MTIAIIAGESSGDQLGSRLMRAIRAEHAVRDGGRGKLRFVGVGGPLMLTEGLESLFPMADIAVNGLFPVIKRLPLLLKRIRQAIRGIHDATPDIAVLIDAQDFNQRVARGLRKTLPAMPIIGYVSPTVWAWRPGRAKKIRPLFNKLMAVLPFEPEVHQRLGGPQTLYVGHPLMERAMDWRASAEEQRRSAISPHTLLVLPGSRHAEISRLLPRFGEAVSVLAERFPDLDVVIPAVAHLADDIAQKTADWRVKPRILHGEDAKWQAFRSARAALAASGTVTLELAMARVPTVVAYRVGYVEGEIARRLISIDSASLPNLILGQKLLPEFIDWGWDGRTLAAELEPLLLGGEKREAQLAGFEEVHRRMAVEHSSPSAVAATIILDQLSPQKDKHRKQ